MRSSAVQFTFAGVNSAIYDLVNFSSSGEGGLFSDTFIGRREIREDKIDGRPSPYFYGVEEMPMSFRVRFGFLGNLELTDDEFDSITDWLVRDEYQPLVFADNPDKVYWVIFTGTPSFSHNGTYQGFFVLTARCLYPYPVTIETQTPDFTIVTSDNTPLDNIGKKSVIPDMNIVIASSGNKVINIYNNDNASVLEITGDYDDVISVDGFNKIITNVTQGIQVGSTKRWMTIDKGINDVVVTGDCVINFKYKSGIYS